MTLQAIIDEQNVTLEDFKSRSNQDMVQIEEL